MNVRLNKDQKIQVLSAADLYKVMQQILLRQQKIDRNREHFWVVGLASDHSILYIELISMGSVKNTLAEPMEVFSFALQKRSVSVMLVHNHPSGSVTPSPMDKDLTEQLIQVGLIVRVPVLDHLVISETDYYSFEEEGLLYQLSKSKKYVPPYRLEERSRKESEQKGEHNKAIEMAKTMKKKGYTTAEIAELTGLTKKAIDQLKID